MPSNRALIALTDGHTGSLDRKEKNNFLKKNENFTKSKTRWIPSAQGPARVGDLAGPGLLRGEFRLYS